MREHARDYKTYQVRSLDQYLDTVAQGCQSLQDGWIAYAGCEGHIDFWRTVEKAHRLGATRLIKRFPIIEGRRIARKIVEEARLINSDPSSSCRITEVILFGSVLTGDENGDAGDIDLVVETGRRSLGKEEMRRITDAEEAAMP